MVSTSGTNYQTSSNLRDSPESWRDRGFFGFLEMAIAHLPKTQDTACGFIHVSEGKT